MKFTVEQFAEANNVEKPVAYGLLRFLAEKNIVTTEKAPKEAGKRGKPAVIYDVPLTVALSLNVTEYVAPALAPVAEVQPTETVSTETVSTDAQPSA